MFGPPDHEFLFSHCSYSSPHAAEIWNGSLIRGLCSLQSETASVAQAAAQTLRHLGPIFILRYGPLWGTMTYS